MRIKTESVKEEAMEAEETTVETTETIETTETPQADDKTAIQNSKQIAVSAWGAGREE